MGISSTSHSSRAHPRSGCRKGHCSETSKKHWGEGRVHGFTTKHHCKVGSRPRGLRRKPIPALVVCERPLLLACNSGGRLRHERYCVCSPRRQLHGVGSQKWEADTLGRITWRSEEHTSELQSRFDLVCRLLLEKKNT